MPLPANFQTITLIGDYVDLTGATVNGTIRFEVKGADRLRDATADKVIIPQSISASISGGSFSVTLPTTNDPDIVPEFTYSVTENFPSLSMTRNYSIVIPFDSASPLSITDITPVGEIASVSQASVGVVIELGIAHPVSKIKRKVLALVTESDVANTIAEIKRKVLALVVESDVANTITRLASGSITQSSSVMGGGFQNAGCLAPVGVGHSWYACSGGDIAGFHVTANGTSWKTANTGIVFGNHRVVAVEGSNTTADRVWGLTSSSPTGGAGNGRLLRGTYSSTTGLITWVEVATGFAGAAGGGSVAPRQTGRLLALDETNGFAYVGSTDGIIQINLSSFATNQRAISGSHVTGLVLDPTDTQLCYATTDAGGTNPGVWRIANIRSGTVSSARDATWTDPQDIVLVTVAGTQYAVVAANTQGVRRWTVSATITTGWTDVTGTLSIGGNGVATVDVFAGASWAATKLLAGNAGENSMTNAGGYSTNGGTNWTNETSWTVSTVPWDETAAWWLGVLKAAMMLTGGSYDSIAIRFDPADSTKMYSWGRSGVWRSADSGSNWRPMVKGMQSTVGHIVGFDSSNDARAYVGDGDWTALTSTDGFTTLMPTMHNPLGANDTGDGVMFRLDNGRVAVSIRNGDVYTSSNLFAGTPTWTAAGFSADCLGAAIGQDGSANEILLTFVSGVGIRRKVGAGAVATVSTLTTTTGNGVPRFCWPNGHTGTQGNVYCTTNVGLLRSTDFGATWTNIHSKTNTSEYTGRVVADPSTIDTLYYTVDNGVAGDTGLWKITDADGTPAATKIGPTVTDPGPCAIHPTTRKVYLTVTAGETGGSKLYRSQTADPGAATSFDDLTDVGWAAGPIYPHDLDVNSSSLALVSNKQGGYFVKSSS